MHDPDELRKRAARARDRKAEAGSDIDLDAFGNASPQHEYLTKDRLAALPEEEIRCLASAGFCATCKERGGTYFQKDASVVHCESMLAGIDVVPIAKALQECEWLADHCWKLVAVDTDKYTAATALGPQNGYVIRSHPGSKNTLPIQACLYAGTQGGRQTAHNIIIAGEDSELHIIAGFAASPEVTGGLHAGVSEFFIGKHARLSFTIVHGWAPDMMVRTRSAARIDQDGSFLKNFICMKPVRSLHTCFTTHLAGTGANAGFCNLVVGSPGSQCDVGDRIYLETPETCAGITVKGITNGGKVISRGHLIGETPRVRAQFECRGLNLKEGTLHAVPELEANAQGAELSVRSASSTISRDEINYLMSRGMSEGDASSVILRGFLSANVSGVPFPLHAELEKIIDLSLRDAIAG